MYMYIYIICVMCQPDGVIVGLTGRLEPCFTEAKHFKVLDVLDERPGLIGRVCRPYRKTMIEDLSGSPLPWLGPVTTRIHFISSLRTGIWLRAGGGAHE